MLNLFQYLKNLEDSETLIFIRAGKFGMKDRTS